MIARCSGRGLPSFGPMIKGNAMELMCRAYAPLPRAINVLPAAASQEEAIRTPSLTLVVCCEFATLIPENRSDGKSSSNSLLLARPPHGDRIIHKELRSLVKQVEMSMASNRRVGSPFDMHVTSWLPDSDIAVFGDYLHVNKWPITRHQATMLEVFPLDQVILLSPDATEPLTHLEHGKIYCLGGIVDRTVCRGITQGWALERGINTRRLPVQEYASEIGMGEGTSRSPVLNISDVVAALVEFHSSGSWVTALQVAIPGRKKRATLPRPKKIRVKNNDNRDTHVMPLELSHLSDTQSS